MSRLEDTTDPSRRFASDLRRIRLARNISLDELREFTLFSETLIAAFERNALIDYPLFEPIHLRNTVRAYALAIGISAEDALKALEQVLAGDYRGSLAVKYLGEEAQPMEVPEPREEVRPRRMRWFQTFRPRKNGYSSTTS